MGKLVFDECDINDLGPECRRHRYWFEAAMISTCEPLFDDCDSNHEVEEKLRKAGVILKSNHTDTESCALLVNFSSLKSGYAFLTRLNKYIEAKQEKLRVARAF